jgi:hypothetical protein
MAAINGLGRLIAITFVSGLLASFAVSTPTLAQAGSTGGTIGKQDKSISGGDDAPNALPSTRAAKPAAASSSPSIIHLKEHNATYGEYTATLKRIDANTYEAVYNQGTTSRMTVTIGQEAMTIERRDTTGGIFYCRGHYTGTRVPGTSRASGESAIVCGVVGATTTWEASW